MSLSPPRLTKWPFFLGDLCLVSAGAFLLLRSGQANVWQALACLAAIGAGAWLATLPFLREFQATVRLGEAEGLATTVGQLANLERIQTQIAAATDQWETVQSQSTQAVSAAKEVTDRIQAELAQVGSFLQKSQEAEKSHLRLEVDKLRRSERDWLQAVVIIMDHVFALHSAAARTGQPALIAQLTQFQLACRDTVRRLGLAGFAPNLEDAFDPQLHQLEAGAANPEVPMRVKQVLALGYTFQTELVRRALVKAEPATVG